MDDMDCCRKPDVAGDLAARAAARRRVVRGLGLPAEIRARRRRPRSAADRGHPARRAGRARHRRAGRRSRLCRPARFDRADVGRPACRRSMLDSFFALHPAMPEFARMYREKQAAVVHAVATPYRDRSHFDGQDVLESGFAGPGPGAVRLAQPRAGGAAARRAGDERAGGRPDHAAGAARRGADRRLGAGRRCRRPTTIPRCG